MSVTQLVPQSDRSPVPSANNGGLDQLCINTTRTLSIDAVQQAKSGHPGTPMALAPLVYTIWNRAMTFDPQDPLWPNRDRFVLSNGHASMLLWSMLHLTRTKAVNAQYERLGQASVTLDDIRHFRQLDRKRRDILNITGFRASRLPPAHSAKVLLLASVWLSLRNGSPIGTTGPAFEMFDYKIFAVCGDGCLMEGVASEAASLAGHLDSTIFAGSTTTTTSPSKGIRLSRSQRTSRYASGLWLERLAGQRCERHRAY